MAKKSSPLEDVFKIIALLPWWLGLVAAVLIYLGLHQVATSPVTALSTGSQMANSVATTIFRALANIFQYILPAICIAASATSAWKTYHRKALVKGATESKSAAYLDGMSWQEFERLVGEGFRQLGYQVVENDGAGPDGGVDLLLKRGNERFLVQCKQWKSFKVGVDVVRSLYGVMAAKGAAGGFVVTSGQFTSDAKEFANGRNIQLLDGNQLWQMLQSAKSVAHQGDHPRKTPDSRGAPDCPQCGSTMVKREAKRGAQVGSSFWGCTAYPKCRGTLPIQNA